MAELLARMVGAKWGRCVTVMRRHHVEARRDERLVAEQTLASARSRRTPGGTWSGTLAGRVRVPIGAPASRCLPLCDRRIRQTLDTHAGT